MPTLELDAVLDIARHPFADEDSDERFDRTAFARRAIDLLRPPRTTVAICEGARRLRIESGRVWGKRPSERWAMLAIPPRASRRAIALALATLVELPRPFVLDVLMANASDA